MTDLDINTPRGQETLADEKKAAEAFEREYGWRYIHTPKVRASKIDAILLNEQSEIAGVVLASARYECSIDKFMTEWDAEWLLTWRKLAVAARVARDLQVMLFGFLYVVDDRLLLIKRLYDPMRPVRTARWLAQFRLDRTETKATVNGGRAVRLNAFVNIEQATRLPVLTDAERAGHPNGFVGHDSTGRFVHFCRCGKDASQSDNFGSLRRGEFGVWYCSPEHRP